MKKFIIRHSPLPTILVWTTMVALVLLAGCAGSPGRTSSEIDQRHQRYIQTNWLQMQDDIDNVLMIDRPSRLSEMFVR